MKDRPIEKIYYIGTYTYIDVIYKNNIPTDTRNRQTNLLKYRPMENIYIPTHVWTWYRNYIPTDARNRHTNLFKDGPIEKIHTCIDVI